MRRALLADKFENVPSIASSERVPKRPCPKTVDGIIMMIINRRNRLKGRTLISIVFT